MNVTEKQMAEVGRLLNHDAYTVKKRSMNAWDRLVACPCPECADALRGKLLQDGNKPQSMLVRMVRALERSLSEDEAGIDETERPAEDVHSAAQLARGLERIVGLIGDLAKDMRHKERHDEASEVEEVKEALQGIAGKIY